MIECKNCRYKGCALRGTDHKIHAATCENYTPATNADLIRAMTDEELADYFSELSCWPNASKDVCMGVANCEKCWLDWLRQEAEHGA